MKKNKIWEIIVAIAIPLIVGGLSAFLTKDAIESFNELVQPPLSPPSFLFPIVWTILFVLMGIASYLIYKNNDVNVYKERKRALILYFIQLIFNFFWSLIFFNLQTFYFAFAWLLVLWILIILLMYNAKLVNKVSYYLLVPYIIWVTFAGYLNLAIAILN